MVAITDGDELTLERDRLLDPHLAGLEAVGEDVFVDLRGAVVVVVERVLGATGLDHHHGDVAVVEFAAGDDDLERAVLGLFVGRVRDPLAVWRVGHADGAERAVERDPRDHQRSRSGVDRQHVVRVVLVGADHGGDDLGLVAEAVGERRAQRPVGEAAGEDRVLGRAAFTTEERAGDLAGGVGTLFDVDRQREEVHARRARLLAALAVVSTLVPPIDATTAPIDSGGETARLKCERLVGPGNRTGHANGVSHEWLLSGDGTLPSPLMEQLSRFPVGKPARTSESVPRNRQPATNPWSLSCAEHGPSVLRLPCYLNDRSNSGTGTKRAEARYAGRSLTQGGERRRGSPQRRRPSSAISVR